MALLDGAFGLRQFEGERWTDPAVRALMARLDLTTDADLAKRAEAYPCALHAIGRDGRTHDVEVLVPPGFATDALDAGTVLEKFARLTDGRLAPDSHQRIVDAVMGLDTAPSCDSLMQNLALQNLAPDVAREDG